MIAIVTSEGLSLREKPGRKYPLVTEVAQGDHLEIIGGVAVNGWAYVRVAKTKNGIQVGMKGYVDSRFVEIDVPRKPPDVEPPMVEDDDRGPPVMMPLLVASAVVIAVVVAIMMTVG
jgi:hypothetical protein